MTLTGEQDIRCGVLTLSDKGVRGERQDTSGPLIREMLEGLGFVVSHTAMLPDRDEVIQKILIDWADTEGLHLIVTTGGTGVSPSDVTPEATKAVIDREVPGISEYMRMQSMKKTVHAVLSRGISGIRGHCLIINLPGSARAARENLEVVLPALKHAIDKTRGSTVDCATL